MKEQTRCSALWLAAALSAGCDDPLADPASISGPRIVAAKVAARGDAALAEPTPGDAASIDWLVLSDRPGSFAASVVWCVAAPTVIGAPRCGASPFAEQNQVGEFGTALRLSFALPAPLAPGQAWLSWLGFCEGGEDAVFDAAASAFRCAGSEPLSGFYRGFVPDAEANRNPSLGDDTLLLGGAVWPEPEPGAPVPPGSACRDRGAPLLATDAPSSLAFELGGDDREPITSAPGTYAAHDRESLVYTHLASHPGLERAFSAIDFDATTTQFEVPFDFGAAAPGPDGELASFYLIVRDERGGVDWVRRDACLTAPE